MSLSHSLRRSSCSLSPPRALFSSLLPQIVWLNRSFHLTFRGSKLHRASLVPRRIKQCELCPNFPSPFDLSFDRSTRFRDHDATSVTMNRCSFLGTVKTRLVVDWSVEAYRYDNSFVPISPRNLNEPFRITCTPPFSILRRILSCSPESKQYFSVRKKSSCVTLRSRHNKFV